MALRDQPYLPLFVQDYLTDEKLNMCSPASQGVYIKLMCLFHKSEPYGGILLKQKDKQNSSNRLNFACKLAKLLPFDLLTIETAIVELLDEKVLSLIDDFLYQKRMVNDNDLSIKRSEIGKKGGKKTQDKNKNFALAKVKANTEYEYEYENEVKIIKKEKKSTERKGKDFITPSLIEVQNYFSEKGYKDEVAIRFFNSYSVANWHDSNDKPVKNWKQKANMVWFKEENKINSNGTEQRKTNRITNLSNSGVSDDYKQSILNRLLTPGGSEVMPGN